MHQSVNLLPDCIILAFLGVQNKHFPRRHPPTPPNIIVRKTVTLDPPMHERILRNFHILTHNKFPLSALQK